MADGGGRRRGDRAKSRAAGTPRQRTGAGRMDDSRGLLEVGETLAAGVAREIQEETGLIVRVVELIEALERIFSESGEIRSGLEPAGDAADFQEAARMPGARIRPRYHYVILDYLCERVSGEPVISEEISDLAFVAEAELTNYRLTPAATRVLHKAFAMARERKLA